MPKHVTKTYSKGGARKPKTSSVFDFDDVTQESDQCQLGFGKNFLNTLPKKTAWSRTNKTVSRRADESAKRTGESAKKTDTSSVQCKRPRSERKDPFAFDEAEDDVTASGLQSTRSPRNAFSRRQLTSSTDLTDKSTDDEAYSSSQELSESSSHSSDRRGSREAKKPLTSRVNIMCTCI